MPISLAAKIWMPVVVGCLVWGVTQSGKPLGAQSTQQNDWPSFLGPNRDGKSSESGLIKDWSQGKLKLLWSRELGETYSAPSVVERAVYHFDRIGKKNVLFCLDLADGKKRWEYRYHTDYRDMFGYSNGPRCSPTIHDDQVIVYGPEGELHSVDRNTGKRRWMVDTKAHYGVVQNYFGVGSTPRVYKGLLIAMVGGSPESNQDLPQGRLDLVRPNGSAIVAFDLDTGKQVWKVGDDLASYASPVIRRLNGKDVGLAFCRSGLLGFEPTRGKQLFFYPWRARSLESVNASTPITIGDDLIFISECYSIGSSLLRWDGKDLKVVWSDGRGRDQAMMTHWNTPIEVDGFIYGSSGRHSREAELRCIEAKSGKLKWAQPDLSRSQLTYIDRHFVLLTEKGQLSLIRANPERFDPVTQFDGGDEIEFRYPCWAAPVICNGKMLILSQDRMFCFQLCEKK